MTKYILHVYVNTQWGLITEYLRKLPNVIRLATTWPYLVIYQYLYFIITILLNVWSIIMRFWVNITNKSSDWMVWKTDLNIKIKSWSWDYIENGYNVFRLSILLIEGIGKLDNYLGSCVALTTNLMLNLIKHKLISNNKSRWRYLRNNSRSHKLLEILSFITLYSQAWCICY